MSDAFDELDDKKQSIGGGGDYADWWTNENFNISEGDELVGVVVEKHSYTDPGGNDHPIATVRCTADRSNIPVGTEASTPTRTSIEDFAEASGVGDLVLIEYEGQVKTNSGRDMHTYAGSSLSQEEWAEMDNAEDILDVWKGSDHFREDQLEVDLGN